MGRAWWVSGRVEQVYRVVDDRNGTKMVDPMAIRHTGPHSSGH